MLELLSRLDRAVGDRYRVVRELGRGATAVVCLAEDQKHHRPVAIKIMKPEVRAAVGPERFLREIEVAAGLSHPNILALHDSGDNDGLLYFVMPYVEGETLRDRLDRGDSITLEEALQITTEVADALEYAHAHGLIHRDIKPANILFQAGHAVVTDFGIARAIDEAGRERMTETGMAIGTVAYMSPEQAMGESKLDGRSDIYSLACVFYEMMAGEAPFAGPNTQALLTRKIVQDPPSVRRAAPMVPETVDRVVTTALATKPADRFSTAAEFSDRLSQANTTEEIRVAELAHRRTRTLQAVAGIGGLIVAATVATWVMGMAAKPEVERFAILPLVNFTNDPDQQPLVDAIHAGLITEMQQAGMSVVARRSVLEYRDSDEPVREIALKLSLDALIEGTIQLTADSVMIEVGLIDAETEEYRWRGSYRDALENIVGLQRRLTRAIADEIRHRLTPEVEAHLAQAQPVNPEAYEAYLRGMTHWRLLTPADLDLAMQYFESAREIDPAFGPAYAGIAITWGALVMTAQVPAEVANPLRLAALAKAVELGSESAEVHWAAGNTYSWYMWDFEQGEASFQRALEINPNYPDALMYYGHLLLLFGRDEEAIAMLEKGLSLDPFNALYNGIYGMALNFVGRYDDAYDVATSALETTPGNATLLGLLRSNLHLQGRYEEAIGAWRESYLSLRDFEAEQALMRGWEEGGYSQALTNVAEVLTERREAGEVLVPAWQLGTLYTRAGDADKAIEWLSIAVDDHATGASYLSVDRIFDELRGDPRFDALIDRVGLPDLR